MEVVKNVVVQILITIFKQLTLRTKKCMQEEMRNDGCLFRDLCCESKT